ncbi:MAG: hypothetical protein AB7F98_13345 [Novosphingobium sp.]
MLVLLAAAAAQAMSAPPAHDADMRCLFAYSFALGRMSEDAATTELQKTEVTTIVMYYMGKLDGRRPGTDLAGELRRITEDSGYLDKGLKPDLDRCGAEVTDRANYLQTFGEQGK